VELIRLEDIGKTYRPGEIEIPVLRGVSLAVGRGELVALMGASGSGKTTLMNILGCLDQPTAGRYRLDGEDVSELTVDQRADVRSRKLGFVFQSYNLLPRTSALDNVLLPLECARERTSREEATRRAVALLERVGLADQLAKEPSQMSGGQQQRVAIARALVNRPTMLLADEPTGNLDSKTSADILRLFQELNAEGVTILLVTHDPEVARHAKRVITIRDGRIVDGGVSVPKPEAGPPPPPSTPAPQPASAGPPAPTAKRVLPRSLATALTALRRNMMRSALTALGIIIGVAAVIAMMEVGQGSRKAVQANIASMGANTILVLPGAASSGGVTMGMGSTPTLTPDDADEIARQCSGVSAVAPIVRARTQVIYGNRNWVPVYIYGTTPSFLAVRDWEPLAEGVAFTDRDVRNGAQVCLVGQTLVRELFRGRSPLGEEIRIQNVSFKVVGVLGRKGANMVGMDQDDVVLAPWTTIKYRVSGATLAGVNQSSPAAAAQSVNTTSQLYPGSQPLYPVPSPTEAADTPQPVRFTTVDQILVKAARPGVIPAAVQQITQLLRQRHRIRPAQEEDFSVRDMTEMMKTLASTSELIGSLLLAVALISLVVGGVGIMNIMLVSVTERTREVGLRMAVGARPGLILRQFLVEAVVLCLVGGAIGVVVGRGTSLLVRTLLHWPTELSYPAIAAAVGVAVTVGVVFGYYPARKASRLNPIDALRHE
jgi:macrolide transport system ATP-binding/permease protein